MNDIFLRAAEKLPLAGKLEEALGKSGFPAAITGVSNIHKSLLTYAASSLRSVCVIVDSEPAARRMAEDINVLSGKETAAVFPAKDYFFTQTEGASFEYEQQRIRALSKLLSGTVNIVIAPADAVMQLTVPSEVLQKNALRLQVGDEIDIRALEFRLVNSGYSKCYQVEGAAQFSRRGDIFDVFPVSEAEPYRIEFFGDEIETISVFDPESQRRLSKITDVDIAPAREIIASPESFKQALNSIKKRARGSNADKVKRGIERELELLDSGLSLSCADKYYSAVYDKKTSLLDYFENGRIYVLEHSAVASRAKAFASSLSADLKELVGQGVLTRAMCGFYMTPAELDGRLQGLKTVYLDTFMRSGKLELKTLINADCKQTAAWGGDLKSLVAELKTFCDEGFCTVLFSGSGKTLDILIRDLREQGIPSQRLKCDSPFENGFVYVTPGALSNGFELDDIRFAVISRTRLGSESKRKKRRYKEGERIKSLSDISAGDLVVHSLYGIGRFKGIKKLETQNVVKDYIVIEYAARDVLYVPVTQLDLITRYIGASDEDKVKLNRLSSPEWKKTKARVKAETEETAKQLLELYAKRQLSKGFGFSPDNDWQMNFEERFEFEETDDQIRCVAEIKDDMQKPCPMDRLLCGDVGFGKTEVALRACMKCMLDSKQCAILVPTTVLAWQHYQTAVKRFEHFPVRIELLSRFKTAAEQKKTVKDLASGLVDMVIGTHRLVQKDIRFKNLGLAVIDEEQRFGVRHKERFKEMFPGIDILTLSATPIPRTLNMAMSGIRDMSTIDDPPQNRQPVQTYVIEHNDGVVANAIERELRRGGQVYYIHNRVETIARAASKLAALIPDAKIGIAHGQMGEDELSEVWRKLVDREIDILVCTTIIETGVDVPNVNTLIIESSDRFGLAQLYQLRGRVGRSSRRAYAYFTFTRGKELSEVASKRLQAIREFTSFGSGFKVALRDLELRGAGSILSGRQHGHMEAVGYEMYLKLLNQAIARQKGEAPPISPEDCLVDITVNAYIPESYIEGLAQRIDAYRKIAAIYSDEDADDVKSELSDRFGKPPRSVLGLIDVSLLRSKANTAGITEITQRGKSVCFFAKDISDSGIAALMKTFKKRIKFENGKRPCFFITLDSKTKPTQLIAQVLDTVNLKER